MKSIIIIFIIVIIFFLIWLITFSVNIRNKQLKIYKIFSTLDVLLYKRIKILYNMMDIIKKYNKLEFEDLNSKLYDYIYDYYNYELNKKVEINNEIFLDIKRILLVSVAYPEIKKDLKYVRYEKQIERCNSSILVMSERFNLEVTKYNKQLKSLSGKLYGKLKKLNSYKFLMVNL